MDSFRILSTMSGRSEVDVIVFANQIQAGHCGLYWILLRMLGLLMAVVVLLGWLERRDLLACGWTCKDMSLFHQKGL